MDDGSCSQPSPIIPQNVNFALEARYVAKLLQKNNLMLVNEVAGISRVVHDISGKPPVGVNWPFGIYRLLSAPWRNSFSRSKSSG